jgi:hypothetical protein
MRFGTARDEIGVGVRVGSERDRETSSRGGGPLDVRETAGIDHQRGAVTEIDEVGGVPDAVVDEPDNLRHGPLRHGFVHVRRARNA